MKLAAQSQFTISSLSVLIDWAVIRVLSSHYTACELLGVRAMFEATPFWIESLLWIV